jgi:hypothetical protein
VGGFFFDFEPFRTTSSDRDAPRRMEEKELAPMLPPTTADEARSP